jgi:hypothetical protein
MSFEETPLKKVICIITDKNLSKNEVYYQTPSVTTYVDLDKCFIYDIKGRFVGEYYYSQFISLADWREQQIDDILKD